VSIIDDLKRLERAGGEFSRTSQKLREAVISVAEKILELTSELPDGTELPRGYIVDTRCGGPFGSRICYRYLMRVDKIPDMGYNEYDIVNGAREKAYYIADDIVDGAYIPVVSRELCLQFSKDIATGLIGEIAEMLEKMNTETAAAVDGAEAPDAE